MATKPNELISVKIKHQGYYNTCWAHAISRNFVRTFQILDVIKSVYIEQFYALFYTILLKNKNCNDGETHTMMFVLLDFILINYNLELFNVTYEERKCSYDSCDEQIMYGNILKNMTQIDQNDFIRSLDYLVSNKLLFIGKYDYVVNPHGINEPSEAISQMLNFKLQPYVLIWPNSYVSQQLNDRNNIIPSIPKSNVYDKKCSYDDKKHAVNLRKWTSQYIEFKNSYGPNTSNNGNFSVTNLNYLICESSIINNDILFASLMFDYDKLDHEWKEKIQRKINLYHISFDITLEKRKSNNYTGSYNSYGLFDGVGKMVYGNNIIYDGEWKNGNRQGRGIINYNGNTYVGQWTYDIINGNGKMTFSNGDIYEGEWRDGEVHGSGIMTFSNGNTYVGQWIKGKSHGNGKMTFSNGDIYEGEWRDGEVHGSGEMNYSNGDIYVGILENGKKHGYGNMNFSNGNRYNGEWKDNNIYGYGKMTYNNGDIYEGNWNNNKMHEYGEMTYNNGDIYDGDWVNNMREGYGKMIYGYGYIYEGDWKNNKYEGIGTMIFSKNNRYEGNWVNGMKNEYGKMISGNGNVYEGNWVNNMREGYGQMSFPNGYIYEGNWVNNMREGNGIMTHINGDKYEGNWENDTFNYGNLKHN